MSNKQGQGGVNKPPIVPAPSPDAARVEPPAGDLSKAPPAPDGTVDTSATNPPFTDPFEPQAGMPPPANPTPDPNAVAAKLAEQDPGAKQAELDAGKGNPPGKSPEAVAKAKADREAKQRQQAEKLKADLREQAEIERTTDPSRNGKPIPEGAVIVRALTGVVVRVQHRQPGERFWMHRRRPKDDENLLNEYAEEFEERDEVEIL
jgi:hypothetical protein